MLYGLKGYTCKQTCMVRLRGTPIKEHNKLQTAEALNRCNETEAAGPSASLMPAAYEEPG